MCSPQRSRILPQAIGIYPSIMGFPLVSGDFGSPMQPMQGDGPKLLGAFAPPWLLPQAHGAAVGASGNPLVLPTLCGHSVNLSAKAPSSLPGDGSQSIARRLSRQSSRETMRLSLTTPTTMPHGSPHPYYHPSAPPNPSVPPHSNSQSGVPFMVSSDPPTLIFNSMGVMTQPPGNLKALKLKARPVINPAAQRLHTQLQVDATLILTADEAACE